MWRRSESFEEKRARARRVITYLRKRDPHAKIALKYGNSVQLLVAVILSAQCTDKKVNEITADLFKKYKTALDFARARQATLERDIHSCGFYRAKAKNIIEACKKIEKDFHGKVPRTMSEIIKLRGVARKTANVVLGNAYGVVEGIAVDTHMIRLNRKLAFTNHTDPVKIERDLMGIIPRKYWFLYTYLIINYGRLVCPARHKECDCPIYKLYP